MCHSREQTCLSRTEAMDSQLMLFRGQLANLLQSRSQGNRETVFLTSYLGSNFWSARKKTLPRGQETVMSISKSNHRCLYMEVEVIMFISTPLTCWDAGKKDELMFQGGSGRAQFCFQARAATHHTDFRFIAVVGSTEVHSGKRIIEAVAQFCCIAYQYSLSP